MFKEISYSNEYEWHEIRRSYIGGSDVSIIMGENPYDDDIIRLWKIKTGREQGKDLSDNPAIIRGNQLEPVLRDMFSKKYPEYEVTTLKKTLVSLKYPFASANLDGVLEHQELGKGVLEIKTATCQQSKYYYDIWIQKDEEGKYTKNDIPLHYWLQVQHYLAVTGWSYAILFADITLAWQKDRSITQTYFCERNDEAIKEIIKKEMEFYSYILNDVEPIYRKKLSI